MALANSLACQIVLHLISSTTVVLKGMPTWSEIIKMSQNFPYRTCLLKISEITNYNNHRILQKLKSHKIKTTEKQHDYNTVTDCYLP